jgi:hypothetical protein
VFVELFVDVRHSNFLTAYICADDTKNLSQVSLCPRTPRREGLALRVAAGLPSSTAAPRGRDAQSRAFLSWPGIEPLYSGVAINTVCVVDNIPELGHRHRRRPALEVLVERGNLLQAIPNLECHLSRQLRGHSSQKPPIGRSCTKTSDKTNNPLGRHGLHCLRRHVHLA